MATVSFVALSGLKQATGERTIAGSEVVGCLPLIGDDDGRAAIDDVRGALEAVVLNGEGSAPSEAGTVSVSPSARGRGLAATTSVTKASAPSTARIRTRTATTSWIDLSLLRRTTRRTGCVSIPDRRSSRDGDGTEQFR